MKNETKPSPLPLEIVSKLKIFGVVSIKKALEPQIPKQDIILSLTAAYELPTALVGAVDGIKRLGADPELFKVGYIVVAAEVDKIAIMPKPRKLEVKQVTPGFVPVGLKTKGKDEMTSYVRYVFGEAGTPEEMKVAEKVLEKFNVKK